MRNATVLTIAPTGTISRIAGCSSAIEPVFAFEFTSKILDGELKDINPIYQQWKEAHPDEPLPDYFVTAHDISPEAHVKMQAAFQKWVDNSVSKTINFPNKASVEDVEKAYLLAYELGTKGITFIAMAQGLNRFFTEPKVKGASILRTGRAHFLRSPIKSKLASVISMSLSPFTISVPLKSLPALAKVVIPRWLMLKPSVDLSP